MAETRDWSARTVVHYTDASAFGGAEQMIVNLLSGLVGRWRSLLLHHDEPGLADLIERCHRLGVATVAVPRGGGSAAIRRFLHTTRPSIFHAHLNWPLACSGGLVAAAWARVPGVVATQQLFAPIRGRRWRLRQKLISAVVDRYIAVSHEMARMLRVACLFGDSKVRVVPNGISLSEFEAPDVGARRTPSAGGTERPLVLTLARLARQKGLEHLIDAASRVPEADFAVAGEGPERSALEARAAARGLGDRFRLLGHRQDVDALLARADAFVLPSLYEGLPVSLLEAMASGLPVIATRIGGTDEVIEHEVHGLLVPPGDGEALAAAIRRILSDRSLAAQLASKGQERVRREFGSETVAARTGAIYEELVEAR